MGLTDLARDEADRERMIWDRTLASSPAVAEAWPPWDATTDTVFAGIVARIATSPLDPTLSPSVVAVPATRPWPRIQPQLLAN